MTKVIAIMSMSLDGYVADPNDGVAEVFDWYFAGDVEVSTASAGSGFTFRVSAPSADHLRGLQAEVGAMLTGRRTFERADAGTAGTRGMCPPSSSPTGCRTAGHGPARPSSSSRTASKPPLPERNRLPPRSPWEYTAPKRSSSAWTPGCSTRSTSIWLPCCWAQECDCSTISRAHRSSSGIRQSSPVWASRICAIPCTPRRRPAAQGSFPSSGAWDAALGRRCGCTRTSSRPDEGAFAGCSRLSSRPLAGIACRS
jgi:hypothetical protein